MTRCIGAVGWFQLLALLNKTSKSVFFFISMETITPTRVKSVRYQQEKRSTKQTLSNHRPHRQSLW